MDGQCGEAIPGNLRLLLVIEAVARAGVPVTPTEVNAELGLPKPTIHRLFATLADAGFLQRDLDGRSYTAGPRLRALASGVLSSSRIRPARQAILKRLSAEVGETCNIALPDGDAMVYLERVETEWPLRIQLAVGTRVPLYCTAAGKTYLASLPPRALSAYLDATPLAAQAPGTFTDRAALEAEIAATRARGYATDRGELLPDMIAVAVPVPDAEGRLLATLSFHAPAQRTDLARGLAFLPQLRTAAAELASMAAREP